MTNTTQTGERVKVTVEETSNGRYRVVRNWWLGVCSGYQVCGEEATFAAAQRRARFVRTHDAW